MPLEMPHQADIFAQFESWQQNLKTLNIRGLIFCAPNTAFIKQLLESYQQQQKNCLILNEPNTTSAGDKHQALLGSEAELVLLDASKTFDVNLYATVSGTLVGGGVLILQIDAQLLKQIKNLKQNKTININNKFCPLLIRVINQHINNASTVVLDTQNFNYNSEKLTLLSKNSKLSEEKFFKENKSFASTQSHLIEGITSVVKGHSGRPLVIVANRGRGKSATLGIACARLMQDNANCKVIICSANFNNLNTFYKHLLKALALQADNKINHKHLVLKNSSEIKFIPADEVIRHSPAAQLVIVDEAAAVPLSQLQKISKNYKRLVFSTTIDGYEGNGQGFEIKFIDKLKKIYPQTQITSLTQPLRWSINDELEKSCYQSLLINKKLNNIEHIDFTLENIQFKAISKQELLSNENLLTEVFTLLAQAHYQTRPSDLQFLLSHKKNTVYALFYANRLLSAALVNQEGGLNDNLCKDILSAKRRLKGELLPQSIVANFGITEAGKLNYLRIMRIVTHPQCLKRGLASYLLQSIIRSAKNNRIDFVGASFAADKAVTSFWFNNHFSAIRLSHSKDSSSGNHCLEIIQPLNNRCENLFSRLLQRFNDSLRFKVRSSAVELQSIVIAQIIAKQPAENFPPPNRYELQELQRFTESKLGFSMLGDLVVKLFLHKASKVISSSFFTDQQLAFLVDCLIKQLSFNQLTNHYNLTGKKAIIAQLKLLVNNLLSAE